jgi:hypothetical protein
LRTRAIAASALFALLVAAPRTATAQDEVRIAQVLRPAGADAEVLISVPRALSGRTLSADAFTVTVDGANVGSDATRESGAGFDVSLVIETSSSAPEDVFVATRAAAVEFVLVQPSGTRVAVYTSDPPALVSGFTTDRSATIKVLREMRQAPGTGLGQAITIAKRSSDPSSSTIIAAATAGEATSSADAIRGVFAQPGAQQVFTVGVLSEALVQLAELNGGFAQRADRAQLVGAFDAIAADIAGRYRLRIPVGADADKLAITVRTPDGSGAGAISLRPATGKRASNGDVETDVSAARVADDEGSDDRFPTAVVAIVGCVVLLGLGLAFVWTRRHPTKADTLPRLVTPATAAMVVVPPPLAPAASAPVAPAPPLVAPAASAPPPRLHGYPMTALCNDREVSGLRAALASTGIVVSQAETMDEALRDVITGRARALYVDGTLADALPLAAAVRQRNEAGWSACPLFVHTPNGTRLDPAIARLADVVVTNPFAASQVIDALASRQRSTAVAADQP